MVSLVVLSNTYVELTEASLRETLDRLYPGAYLPATEQGNWVTTGPVEGASFGIQCLIPGATGIFNLYTVPGPYTEFSDFANHVADHNLRSIAESQRCWLSVDRLHGYDASDEDGYRFIAALLGALAPADAAVLVHPSQRNAVAFTPEIRRQLAAGTYTFGIA